MTYMILKRDPTQTLMIRNILASKFGARFRKLKGDIRTTLTVKDSLALRQNQPADFMEWRGYTDSQKIKAFREWLDNLIDKGVIDRENANKENWGRVWWTPYLAQGYQQGVSHAFQSAQKAGVSVPFWSENIFSVANMPVHKDALFIIYEQAFSELKGITESMSQQIQRVLADGIRSGLNPYKVADQINSVVDKVGIKRAKLLARTETVRAHAEGTLNTLEQLGVDEVSAEVEWGTAGDDRVCPICAPMNGVVFDIREAHGKIPAHPLCRCAWLPMV